MFKDGDQISGYAQATSGMARIEFKAVIRRSGVPASSGVDVLEVTEFRRVQMRNYSRANLAQPIVFRSSPLTGAPHFSGEIINISAGGLALLTSQEIPAGAVYLLEFTIPWTPPIAIRQYAKIVQQTPSPDAPGLLFTACEFILIDKTDRLAARNFEAMQKTLTVFVNQYNIRLARMARKKAEDEK